jgi:hypothetical protein
MNNVPRSIVVPTAVMSPLCVNPPVDAWLVIVMGSPRAAAGTSATSAHARKTRFIDSRLSFRAGCLELIDHRRRPGG